MTEGLRPMVPIPISAAKMIADSYGYDQVVVIARRVGEAPEPHGEHCTTYGRTPGHCAVAARMGDTLKHRVMAWPDAIGAEDLDRLTAIVQRALLHTQDIRDVARTLAADLRIVSVPARNT